MTETHTPTPWKGKHQGKFLSTEWTAEKEGRARGGCTTAVPIKAGKQTIALVVSEGWDDTGLEANAEFIVQACNAHDDLVAALEGAIGALEFSRDFHSDLGNEDQAFAQDKLDAATAALAKARGEA